MYKIGDKIKPKTNSLQFDINRNYELASIRISDGKFLVFDSIGGSNHFNSDEINDFFEIVNNNSLNNGGSTDYYKFKENWKECQDIIEDRELNFSQGNIFKSAFCFNIGRHNATDYTRELNKIIYFANRELKRIEKENLF